MKVFGWFLLVAIWAGSSAAEMRIWTAEDGSKFRGEFTRELLGKIQVRDADGKLHLMPVDNLSKADLHYLQTTICPDVKIEFRKKSRIRPFLEWTIQGDRTTLYTCTVNVFKKSDMDSKVKLTVELYVIGEMVDSKDWVLVERASSKFVFPEGKKSTYTFEAKDIPCRKYLASWANDGHPNFWRGIEYLGYIAVVLDPKGNVIAHKSDLETENWMEPGIQPVVDKLRALYMQGRGSQFSRIFNEKIQKASVPQVPWYTRTKNPGG